MSNRESIDDSTLATAELTSDEEMTSDDESESDEESHPPTKNIQRPLAPPMPMR